MMETAERSNEFGDTPEGWARRWSMELTAAEEALKKWHATGQEIVKRFRDERESEAANKKKRLNLFSANVLTQHSLLYGKTPRVSVSRRFADAQDDVARVAGELYERLLNADIERTGDTYAEALDYALQDLLLPGLGLVRIRYVSKFEPTPEVPEQRDPTTGAVLAPAVPAGQRKVYECVETDYVHWRDVRWSPARVWHEVRWVAFRAEMSDEEGQKRFGAAWAHVPLKSAKERSGDGEQRADPWQRAEVWEIWDRDSRRVFWYVEGHNGVLDQKDDPLGLDNFFPCPRPLLATTSTDSMVPRPDYVLAQDQYEAVNRLETRIALLEKAVRVVGLYDQTLPAIQRLLSDAEENQLLPVPNWAQFAEKAGLKGLVDWFPIEQVVNALTVLQGRLEAAKQEVYEITGMSDLMRGQQVANGTPGEAQVKARFASVRMQRLQDKFAAFATGVQRLKAEVIAKHFDPSTIIAQSNAQFTPDAALAQQAVALIKERYAHYRVEVKSEALALEDMAQLQGERTGMLAAVTGFSTAAAPLAQQIPGSLPFLLRMLQWFVSGQRGASEIEGVLDQAIQAAEQMAQQPQAPQQPDPKLLTQQLKGQQEMQKVQEELKADLIRTQAEVQADEQRERNQARWNLQEAMGRQQISDMSRAQQPAQGVGGPRGGRP